MQHTTESLTPSTLARRGWWAVGIFALAAVLSYTDRQILALLVDPIRADMHISDAALGVLQGAAFAVLYSCIGLPLGRIADVVPRRALLLFAVVAWSLGTVACGFSHSFWELFAARVLVGIGEAALAPAAMSLIADYFPPDRRALPTGVFFTGMVVGGGAAFAIGGFLFSAAQHAAFAAIPGLSTLAPWRTVLVVLGLSGIAVAALLSTLHEPNSRSGSWQTLGTRLTALRDIPDMFRGRIALLAPLYAAMGIGSIVDYAVLSWMPALLSRRFAMPPADIGVTLGGAAVAAGLIGTLLGGILADKIAARFGLLARIRLCGAIMLAGLVVAPIGILGSSTLTVAATFFWLFLSSTAGTIGVATTLDLLPQTSRGLGTSTIAFCNTIIGLGLGPTLVARATERAYGGPEQIGLGMSTVAAPAIAASSALFFVAAGAERRNKPAFA